MMVTSLKTQAELLEVARKLRTNLGPTPLPSREREGPVGEDHADAKQPAMVVPRPSQITRGKSADAIGR